MAGERGWKLLHDNMRHRRKVKEEVWILELENVRAYMMIYIHYYQINDLNPNSVSIQV